MVLIDLLPYFSDPNKLYFVAKGYGLIIAMNTSSDFSRLRYAINGTEIIIPQGCDVKFHYLNAGDHLDVWGSNGHDFIGEYRVQFPKSE